MVKIKCNWSIEIISFMLASVRLTIIIIQQVFNTAIICDASLAMQMSLPGDILRQTESFTEHITSHFLTSAPKC